MVARGADPWPERPPRTSINRLGFAERLDEPFDPMLAFAPVQMNSSATTVGNSLHTTSLFTSYPPGSRPVSCSTMTSDVSAPNDGFLPLGNAVIKSSYSRTPNNTRNMSHLDADQRSQKPCPKCSSPELVPARPTHVRPSPLAMCENINDEPKPSCKTGPLRRVRKYALSVFRSLRLPSGNSTPTSGAVVEDERQEIEVSQPIAEDFTSASGHDALCPMATRIPHFFIERGHLHDM